MIIKGGQVWQNETFSQIDIRISEGMISEIGENLEVKDNEECLEVRGNLIVPGFQDVHVHLREPGFEYKETIGVGSMAAAKGGYTTICTMPNLNPVPDCLESLQIQLESIKKNACIEVLPFGAITVGEKGQVLSDMQTMNPYVVGYSDDGKGVQNEAMMRQAMCQAKVLNQTLSLHCEDEALVRGGYVHEGEFSRKHGYKGICSESEYGMIAREIELIRETKCPIHICHISAKESVELIAKAKREGLPITCEVTPHHLLLEDSDVLNEGNFKMNPPVRSHEDREALIKGLIDGTIDTIATDHAPHSEEEKSRGLEKSAFGIIGIENAFSLLYTKLVKTGIISLSLLIEKLTNGYSVLTRTPKATIQVGSKANLCILDLEDKEIITKENLVSTSKNTPFLNSEVYGLTKYTIYQGKVVYNREQTKGGK